MLAMHFNILGLVWPVRAKINSLPSDYEIGANVDNKQGKS
jgi:hypothetical protein